MKRLLILPGVVFLILSLHAQELSPQVVSASGKTFSSPVATLDFTIAEVMTSTFTNGSNDLTQGFHQPQILFTSVENNEPGVTFSLYPNPTDRFVTIASTLETVMQVHIYDSMGKAIETSSLFNKQITIDLQTLFSGLYIMVITSDAGKPLFTYTLIKSNL